jgi:hypothetical protein
MRMHKCSSTYPATKVGSTRDYYLCITEASTLRVGGSTIQLMCLASQKLFYAPMQHWNSEINDFEWKEVKFTYVRKHLCQADVIDVSEERNVSIFAVEVYSSTLIRSSEKFVHCYLTTGRYNPDYFCGLVVRVPGYQIFWVVVGLERGSLSLVSTTEELLGRKSNGSGLENREYGWKDPSRCLRDTPLFAKVGITFVDMRRSLGRHISLMDSGYGVFSLYTFTDIHAVYPQPPWRYQIPFWPLLEDKCIKYEDSKFHLSTGTLNLESFLKIFEEGQQSHWLRIGRRLHSQKGQIFFLIAACSQASRCRQLPTKWAPVLRICGAIRLLPIHLHGVVVNKAHIIKRFLPTNEIEREGIIRYNRQA